MKKWYVLAKTTQVRQVVTRNWKIDSRIAMLAQESLASIPCGEGAYFRNVNVWFMMIEFKGVQIEMNC